MSNLQTFRDQLKQYQKQVEIKASNELSKLRGNAEKRLRDTNRRLKDLSRDSEEFRETITEDSNAMDKYSHKIYETIQNTLESIETPDKITLRNLNQYLEAVRKALSDQDAILIKYVQLLKDKKYKGRVKTLDRSLKRLNKDLTKLEDFIQRDYTPSASIEQAPDLIEETLDLTEEYEDRYQVLLEREDQVKRMDSQIEELEEEVESVRNHPIKEKYQRLINEYEQTQREIDHTFASIRKVFRKYDKLGIDGNDIDTALMSNLVTDAASTMAEMKSIASIHTLLGQMYEILEDTALNLNKEKREAAKSDIRSFLDGELDRLNNKATSTIREKEETEQQMKELDLDSKLEHAESQLSAAIRDRNRAYLRQLRALNQISDQIDKNINEINRELNRVLDDDIKIEMKLLELPLWVENTE